MDSYPVTASLVIDPIDVAWHVQSLFAPYLKQHASVGLWLPERESPTLVPEKLYFKQGPNAERVQIQPLTAEAFKNAQGDIFDEDGHLVLPERLAHRLKPEPTLPIEGLRIVRADVETTIHERSRKWCKKPYDPIDIVLRHLLREEYAGNERLIVDLAETMNPIRRQVVDFIGQDEWVMHFARPHGWEIIVDKSIDYRIYDWERRMRSGEWLP